MMCPGILGGQCSQCTTECTVSSPDLCAFEGSIDRIAFFAEPDAFETGVHHSMQRVRILRLSVGLIPNLGKRCAE